MTILIESNFARIAQGFRFQRSFGLMFGLVLVVVAVAACGGSSKSDSKDVVFSADVNGNTDIFKLGAEGGGSVRLTTATGRDFSPMWSPNKEQIAFLSDRNGATAIWLMDTAGESKKQLTAPGRDVTGFRWSPDSVRIAVESQSNGVHSISILDTETQESIALTSPAENVRVGDWSPDGEWVVYEVSEGDDSAIRRRNPTGVDEITLMTGYGLNPRWSKNGQWIAFHKVNEEGFVDLAVMNKDGDNESIIARGVTGVPFDWSPDSKRLVFESQSTGNNEIYVVDKDGDNADQLTSNRVEDWFPLWSRDGSSILFLSEGDGSFDVYSMGKSGDQQVRMTSIDGAIVDADW